LRAQPLSASQRKFDPGSPRLVKFRCFGEYEVKNPLQGARSSTMFRIVLLQILATAVVSLLSGLVGGTPAAVSALLGGAACFIPNGLFAWKLAAASRRPQGTDAAVFLIGEFVKVVSTVALLALVVFTYKHLVWLAMLISIIAVLKSYVLALLIK